MRTEELDSETPENLVGGDSGASRVRAPGAQLRVGMARWSIPSLKSLLFENRNWKQILIRNAIWATAAEAIVRLLKIVQVLLVVRYFGPTDYGKFTFAFSFASMFSIVFDAGLLTAATREFAIDKDNEKLLGDVVLMKIGLGVLGMLGMIAGTFWITKDQDIRATAIVLGLYMLVSGFTDPFCAVFRARQRMESEAYIRAGQAALLLAAVGAVLWWRPSILGVSCAYLGSAVISVGVVGLAGSWRLHFIPDWEVWKRFLRIALPLGLVGGVMTLYGNLDSVMLGHWGMITETGWYNAANKINALLLLPMTLVMLVTLPAFASSAGVMDDIFRKRWDQWTTGMIALGLLFGALVWVVAEPLVQLVFGPAFRPAGGVLQVLILSAVLVYFYTPCFQALITFGQTTKLFWALLCGGVVNVILNAGFIPRYGFHGAAWAAVATHLVILCGLVIFASTSTPVRPINAASCSAFLCSAVAAGLAYMAMKMAPANLWVRGPLGILVFGAVFLAMRRTGERLVAKSGLFSADSA